MSQRRPGETGFAFHRASKGAGMEVSPSTSSGQEEIEGKNVRRIEGEIYSLSVIGYL